MDPAVEPGTGIQPAELRLQTLCLLALSGYPSSALFRASCAI